MERVNSLLIISRASFFWNHTFLWRIIFLFGLFQANQSYSQSLPGLSGGYSIPSAYFQKDRTLYFGYTYLNSKYYDLYSNGNNYSYSLGYFGLTILPFAEVSVRLSYPNGYNKDHEDIIMGDRMISGRLRVVKERKYWPAIVVGLQGFYKTTGDDLINVGNGGPSFFNSSYLVMSKNFYFNKVFERLRFTAGYGSDIVVAQTYQFIGLFGGINISPKNVKWLELMLEYDADKWNAGMRVTILKHVVILAGFEGMDSFSGAINYKFRLP
jgi:hypothetical protein